MEALIAGASAPEGRTPGGWPSARGPSSPQAPVGDRASALLWKEFLASLKLCGPADGRLVVAAAPRSMFSQRIGALYRAPVADPGQRGGKVAQERQVSIQPPLPPTRQRGSQLVKE